MRVLILDFHQNMSMNQRKRILVLTDAFQGLGGSERNITQLLVGIDRDKFEICIACFGSGNLSEFMKEQGFDNIANLAGGIVDWERDGLPINTDITARLSGSCMCQLKPRDAIKRKT